MSWSNIGYLWLLCRKLNGSMMQCTRLERALIVLEADRPAPSAGESRQRGEGVAIVLGGPAVQAWKASGKQWKAWSSRLVTATLHTGKSRSDRIHILSCYAPTFSASRADKEHRRAVTNGDPATSALAKHAQSKR